MKKSKTFTKLLAEFLTVIMLLSTAPVGELIGLLPRFFTGFKAAAENAEIIASGECGADGDNLTWTLADDGTLTISGLGEMNNYKYTGDDVSPFYHNTQIKSLIVESGVLSIGKYAFVGCSELRSVLLPECFNSIEPYAFNSCTNLESINIPEGTTSIGNCAFYLCSSLKTVTIPSSVIQVSGAFYCCYGLENIEIKNNIIGVSEFSNCFRLGSVVIPDGVTTIPKSSFSFSGITEITIPGTVTYIDEEAFATCSKLEHIYVDEANEFYCSKEGVLFNKDCTTLIRYPANSPRTEYSIPSTVTEVALYGFEAFKNLICLRIPDSVIKIGKYALDYCDKVDYDSLVKIERYYCGNEEEWEEIEYEGNSYRLTDVIHFEAHVPGDEIETIISPDCINTGMKIISRSCTICDKKLTENDIVLPSLGHDWGDWHEKTAATYDACGEEERVCKRDASHKETRPTPALTPDNKNNESIQTEKTAIYDTATGEATISLSAESKGQTIRTKTTTPLDIVLVLDQSGSMTTQMGSGTTRLTKLKNAASSFIDQIASRNSDDRIAIVGFAMGASAPNGYTKYENTEILSLQNPVTFDPTPSKIPQMNAAYRNALVPVKKNQAVNSILTDAVTALSARGATAADLGLLMACKVFEQNPNTDGRKRVVVFMTDGEPTYASDFSDIVANYARSNAALLKNAYGADVYSVGVIGTGISQKCEQFLKDVSSGTDYYYRVTNADALMNSFNDIAEESVKVETAFDDVTLVDTVTKEFTLTQTQEQALRLSAVETLGVEDKDIAIDRLEDGTTQIRIAHIHPKMEQRGEDAYFTIDFSFAVSANENALDSAVYATNTDNAGVKIGEETIFEQQFQPVSVTVEAAEGVVCFNLNGAPFHMVRFHAGDKLTAPTLTLEGTHTFSGWTIPAPLTFTNGKVELEATLTQPQYTVTWNIDGTQTVEYYEEGAILTAPQVGLSGDGKVFSGWTPVVPSVMPARNLTFTAQYAVHTHRYEEQIMKTASCGVAGLKRFTCACGDSYEETIPALSHTWTTFATEAATGQGNFSYIVCANCGATQEMSFAYQVEVPNSKTQPYDLSLRDLNNGKVQPTDGGITITLPIPSEMRNAKDIKVYRIEADGSRTDMGANKTGWNSVQFTTDHFSPYILEAIYACETNGNHAWNDGEVTKAATCSAQGEKTFVCTDCGATKTETVPFNANAHSLTFVPAKNATTDAEGNVAHYHCTDCGKNFSDANGTQQLSKVTTDKLPKQDEPQRDPNACRWCGKVHNGFFQKIIGFFHNILAAILGAKY